MPNPLDRRQFLTQCSRGGVVTATAGFAQCPLAADATLEAASTQVGRETSEPAASADKNDRKPRVAAFTKSFQEWPIPRVCREFRETGLDGLDLTVRPGGHIEPDAVTRELPAATQAARDEGVQILMLTTSITEPDADAERILAAAEAAGIDRIKIGYYRYKGFGRLAQRLDQVRRQLQDVARLCERFHVLPCVHIHSGPFLPSHGTMLYDLIRDLTPQQIGAYVDPLHMTVEGGREGWRQGLDLLAPWIALASVKNFSWVRSGRDRHGQMQWHTQVVPVADGVASLPDFVNTLKTVGYQGTYSLHSEYKGGHSFRNLSTQACLEQTAKDLAFVKRLFA